MLEHSEGFLSIEDWMWPEKILILFLSANQVQSLPKRHFKMAYHCLLVDHYSSVTKNYNRLKDLEDCYS